MSLPASQQRILDGIADALRISEPRLASMFAMFTRLTKNEAAPWREQLPRRRLRDVLTAIKIRCSGRSCGARWFALRLSQLALGLVLAGLVISMTSHRPAGCIGSPTRARASAQLLGLSCPQQASGTGALVGKQRWRR